MKDIIGSISTIKNFMGNVGRNKSMDGNTLAKPVRVKVGHNGGSTDGCPVCKKDFYEKVNYYPMCGKAIDWSE